MKNKSTFLFLDSGSTKTEYAIVEDGIVLETNVIDGLNPYYKTADDFSRELGKIERENFKKIFFFGSGVSNAKKEDEVRLALLKRWPKSTELLVGHDLDAAAFSTGPPEQARIACILGTGSNSCLYKEGKVLSYSPSLGYVLGDEGAGVHLGKSLLRDYFYGKLPNALKASMEEMAEIDLPGILEKVYKGEAPNSFIASFAKVLSAHEKLDYVQELQNSCFGEFIESHIQNIPNYEQYPVCFVGSVAKAFEEKLRALCLEKKLSVEVVLDRPMMGLIKHFAQ